MGRIRYPAAVTDSLTRLEPVLLSIQRSIYRSLISSPRHVPPKRLTSLAPAKTGENPPFAGGTTLNHGSFIAKKRHGALGWFELLREWM